MGWLFPASLGSRRIISAAKMADIRIQRVRFKLRQQAIQAVFTTGYSQPETWRQLAYNQHQTETELLVLYDAAIAEDSAEDDPDYQVWRDYQADVVAESQHFLAATGAGFRSSWIAAR